MQTHVLALAFFITMYEVFICPPKMYRACSESDMNRRSSATARSDNGLSAITLNHQSSHFLFGKAPPYTSFPQTRFSRAIVESIICMMRCATVWRKNCLIAPFCLYQHKAFSYSTVSLPSSPKYTSFCRKLYHMYRLPHILPSSKGAPALFGRRAC